MHKTHDRGLKASLVSESKHQYMSRDATMRPFGVTAMNDLKIVNTVMGSFVGAVAILAIVSALI